MEIRADGEAEVSVGGRGWIRVAVILRLESCNRGEEAICLDSLAMAGQAERVDCEEEENVCQSQRQQVPFCPDGSEAKSAAKKRESRYERHARSAEPANECALWELVDSCFHEEIWGRCLWAESIHVCRISHVPEK